MMQIKPIKDLNATVSVPGSKYIANRLLIICSLAKGTSVLNNVPDNDDINNSIRALQQFGVQIKKNKDILTIVGTSGKLKQRKNEINVGDSGTLLRFISGLAALSKGKTKITGSSRIKQRPIIDLLKSLNDLGVKSSSRNGHAPLIIKGGNFRGGRTEIKGDVSSQFISSLLLTAPYAKGDVQIVVKGKLVSPEYVDLTIDLMNKFGIEVKRGKNTLKIKSGQKYMAKKFNIPSDWSSANYFFAAAAIVPGTVRISNLDMKSMQPESGFIELLVRMGCKALIEKNSVQITGPSKLKAIAADMSSMPDSAQTLAVTALFANGATKLSGISNLKFKESDRINDTAAELRKIGAVVKITGDGMEITPKKLNPVKINTRNDHRMAMSFAIAGLKIPGVKIENPKCANKSFMQFWQRLGEITNAKKEKNIVLIGYRGAGKTSTANELSKLTGIPVISTDGEILRKTGMKLGDFINKYGWGEFRQIESEIIRKIEGLNGIIIDCGGGVVEIHSNIKLLKKNSTVFWLKAPANILTERVRNKKTRPSITGKRSFTGEIEQVLERRAPLYKKAADFEISTENKTPIEAAKLIIEKIKNLTKTKICTSITADNVKDSINYMKKASSSDLIELRLDFHKDISAQDLKKMIQKSPKPTIVTCRPAKFGGMFNGSEEERLALLSKAICLGANFIDVEFKSGIASRIIKNKSNSQIIVSHHDFEKTPSLEELNSLYNETKKSNPDFVKIVTRANSINDNFTFFELLKDKNDLIAFCMGQSGEISRILAPKFGSRITYCSLDNPGEPELGQIALQDMKNLYHTRLINKDTNIIGIIGEFAENSMSKYMHNPNFVKNGLNFVYIPFKVATNELKQFMENFRKFGFKGAAVTIPHKGGIVKYIDGLDETSRKIGATNTLVNDKGKITGYNTDYYGAVQALKEKIQIKGKKTLVIGAGGAARAVIYGLKKEGASLTAVNRTIKKAQKLSDEFKIRFDGFDNLKKSVKNNDIIINTTSVGMAPNQNTSILGKNHLVKDKLVMDLVYKPANTKLIRLAREKECRTITGDRMLVYQAVRQFELWTGVNPGFKNMELQLLKQMSKGG